MIAVNRGAEPAELEAARLKRLPAARLIWDRDGASKALKDTLVGYDPDNKVKRALYNSQHEKCAYCERRMGFGGLPVEHFRPKGEAWRHQRGEAQVIDKDRYWWLTWSWSNLFFACQTCNCPVQKGNYFRLKAATAPLPIHELDTALESPLLLDPSRPGFDIRDHLRWRPVDTTAHRRRWLWHLETLTSEGDETAEIFGLPFLADEVGQHYRATVWPRFRNEVDQLSRAGAGPRAIAGALSSLSRDLVRAEANFTAATWFMLDALRRSTPPLRELRLPSPHWPP